ncbi:MAG: M23 family metallopeptidase, partial [Longimicrobiales bacterium]
AELINEGRSYHAIWFDPNGDGDGTYYDLEGQSVRRAFLKKPLEFRRISSRYAGRRFHPVLQRWRAHRGVDYSAASGTPIQATGDGVVIRRNWSDTYGNVIDLRHPNGFVTRYAHMSRWGPGVVRGSRVKQGEVIGYVGMTGLATGPHLHYEMRVGDRPIDPLAIELPPGDPVPTGDWQRWEQESASRLAMLLKLPDPETFRADALEPLATRSEPQ